ncbi:hypothetical protein WJX84_008648 [Apatococcus fuscideae]|uniref:Uncharacterized protein n=1 Tax=Apatococcus fuscideae TaxID=2026836 RepID=A0AAW1T785_9CHLO
MCPLRFLLAGLSALLALLVAFHVLSGPGAEPAPEQEKAKTQPAAASTLSNWSCAGRAALDFCTGKEGTVKGICGKWDTEFGNG